ncbi:MAG: tetratricopeptide repeat protein [Magnetococcus sp. XQGC-1]
MLWIWILPVVLCGTLAVVLQPLFSREGNRPLPVGLEGDPWAELTRQRDRLLRQLKEWQAESGGDAEDLAIQNSMEQELAAVLARLDQLAAAAVPGGSGPLSRGDTPWNRLDMGFAAAILVLVVVLAGGLYLTLGRPLPPSAAAMGHPPAQEELLLAIDRLAQRLQQEPDNLSGWLRLARSQAMVGNTAEAKRAYAHVLSRQKDHAEASVGLAELQVQSGVEAEIRQGVAALEGILEKNPAHPEALWLVGAVAARAGDMARAIDLWQRLLPLLPEGSEARVTVEKSIAEARAQMKSR